MFASRRRVYAAAACALLAVLHTWPLVLAPGRHSRNDNGDTQLNEWILAWVAHQLPRDPAHLFEANIFYPAHDTLAFSEPLIVPALMGAPMAWMGASPVLVYNIVLLAGFALSALAAALLIEAWTGDMLAGVMAGSMFAFNTATLSRTAHPQGVHLYGLPFALFAADHIITRRSPGGAVLLAASMLLMTYTSGYLVVFACVMIGVVVAVRVPTWWVAWRRTASLFGGAAVTTVVLALPVIIPYARVAREQHMVRSLDNVEQFSATLTAYIRAAGRIHFETWSGRFFGDSWESFFPGVVILALALFAIARQRRQPEWHGRTVMLLAIALAGVLLSLGTTTLLYGWLFTVFPPMRGLRAAARFGSLFLLAVAVLGGMGLAFWKPRAWVAILLIALANLESLRAPIGFHQFTGIPAVYRLLADEPGRVVLAEQPFYRRLAISQNAPYVLNSTANWKPLMNGYSGYAPDAYDEYADTFSLFPEEGAFMAMKAHGVTHVMVHPDRLAVPDAAKAMEEISHRPDMELVGVSPGAFLYRLKP